MALRRRSPARVPQSLTPSLCLVARSIPLGRTPPVGCAAYWVGSTETTLPGTSGIANSIFVSGASIYTAGYYNNGTAFVACYWTGTTKTDLPGSGGQATAVTFLQ